MAQLGLHARGKSGEVGGALCGTLPPRQQCLQRCGSGCESRCLQTLALPLQTVLSVLSDSQYYSGHPLKARITQLCHGFELHSLGSQLGRTHSTKTYSRWLTRNFLKDENHVSLGLSTYSVWFFVYVCGFFGFVFGGLQGESRNICAVQIPSKKMSPVQGICLLSRSCAVGL